MDDDFNTADAISTLFDLAKDINTNITINSSKELCNKALELIRELGKPLGILQKSTKGKFRRRNRRINRTKTTGKKR